MYREKETVSRVAVSRSGIVGPDGTPKKNRGLSTPAAQLVVARIKLLPARPGCNRASANVAACLISSYLWIRLALDVLPKHKADSEGDQALLRGRSVKSRTCAKTLDICMPFSCETKGSSSAIN